MADFILALDQGTTSSRAILFDRGGALVATAQAEFRQHYPRPGWVEHDPNDIWQTQLGVAQAVLREAGVSGSDLDSIGITNQRETALVWDRATGEPIHHAIVWQDRRTARLCDELRAAGFDTTIRDETGLVTDAYFSGTKVAWLLDNVPGARERANRGELAFGTVDTYLMWRLTGGRLHLTDVTNACRTMLYNIHTLDWSDAILQRLNIPRSVLPAVRPSSQVYGETEADLFGVSVPLAGIAGDQQAATFGQVVYVPGLAKNTYGTGCFLLLNTGGEAVASNNNLLTTIAWQLGGEPVQYALEGSIFIAGAAVQWLRDELGLISHAADTQAIALSVNDTQGVYLVPAFVGLGAPHWDQYARGAIVGLTRGVGRAEIVRATLESVAYQTRDVAESMVADSGLDLQTLRVDGGMVPNDFLMQFQADILGVTVQRPAITETTALGAAYLAGLATGFYGSLSDLVAMWSVERTFEPRMSDDQRESLYAGWRKAVERAKHWADE